MVKRLVALLFLLLSQGCMAIATPAEEARVGSTYEVAGPWCNKLLADGTRMLAEGDCELASDNGRAGGIGVKAGTCFALGKVSIGYPNFKLRRTAHYAVVVGGAHTGLTADILPGGLAPAKTLLRKDCVPA